MPSVPVISSFTLRGIPSLVRAELGEKVLIRATQAAGIDFELLEDRNCFIPHAAALAFVDATARAAGDADLGLVLVPHMDVANYGSYGDYLIGAGTLGAAIGRAISALGYHSAGDTMSLSVVGGEARYSYRFALAGQPGYDSTAAAAAAGVLMSLCRRYLNKNWRPLRVELDIPRPRRSGPYEDHFGCPVVFAAPVLTVVLQAAHLAAPGPGRSRAPAVTLADVIRDRHGVAPKDVAGVVAEQIRLQVLCGAVSVDATARATGMSVRTLQRELNRAGTDFRAMTGAARTRRAVEMLADPEISITRISMELGYSTPANLTRAFRRATGRTPRDFRARALRAGA